MEYSRSPLRIVVMFAASKGPVRVITTLAYIYRRSAKFRANDITAKSYWTPKGEYFVRYAGLSFPVNFSGNGFRLEINFANYMRMLQVSKERKSNGSNSKSKTTQVSA